MSTPQSAILPEAGQHALYMVINVTENKKDLVKQYASLPALIETIKNEHEVDKLSDPSIGTRWHSYCDITFDSPDAGSS